MLFLGFKRNNRGIIHTEIQIRKEWFTIDSHGIEHTEKMEQAFRDVHGFGIDEYQNDTNKIVEVEQRRERDYQKGQLAAAKIERLVHRD